MSHEREWCLPDSPSLKRSFSGITEDLPLSFCAARRRFHLNPSRRISRLFELPYSQKSLVASSKSVFSLNPNNHSISVLNPHSSQNTNTASIPVLNSLSSQNTDIHLISVLNTTLLNNKKSECTRSEDVCSYCKIPCIACKHMFVKIIGETRTTLVSFVSFLKNEACSSKKEIGFLQLLLQTHFLCCMSELQKHCTRKKLPKTNLSRKMPNL
jgi:hypothetical protein